MSEVGMCEGCTFKPKKAFLCKECTICVRNPHLVSKLFHPTTYLGQSISRPVDMFISSALQHLILGFFKEKLKRIEGDLKREKLIPRYIPPKPWMQSNEQYYWNDKNQYTGMQLINPSIKEERKIGKDLELDFSDYSVVLGDEFVAGTQSTNTMPQGNTVSIPWAVTFKGMDYLGETKKEEEKRELPKKESPGRIIKLPLSKLMEELEEVGEGDES